MSKKTWKYTLNNYTKRDIEFFERLDCNRHRCSAEIGEKGTPHLQGIITFTRTYRLKALKKLHEKVHWEIAICDDFNYENKIDSEWLINTNNSKQGKRIDINRLKEMITEKKNDKEIFEELPEEYLKYGKMIKNAQQLYIPKRNWEMEVHIRWGKPGTGKTRFVWDTYGIDNVYAKSPGKWWDHYTGEEVVLIDDFDPEHSHEMVFDYWLKLCDRYPMIVEYKGGSCNFSSKKIYITSNFNPEGWFTGRTNRKAFFRRVVTVTEVD